MGTGLQQGSQLSRTSGLSLGGLNLAGTQKGTIKFYDWFNLLGSISNFL